MKEKIRCVIGRRPVVVVVVVGAGWEGKDQFYRIQPDYVVVKPRSGLRQKIHERAYPTNNRPIRERGGNAADMSPLA